MDQQTKKGDYYGFHQANLGSKIEKNHEVSLRYSHVDKEACKGISLKMMRR